MHFRFFIIFVSHAEMFFATSHAPVGATTLSDMKGAVEKQKQKATCEASLCVGSATGRGPTMYSALLEFAKR